MNIWNNYKFNKDFLEAFSCQASYLRWPGSTKHKPKRKQKQKQKRKQTQKRKQMQNSTKAKPQTQKRKRKRKSKEHGKVLVHHAWSKLHPSPWIVGSIITTPKYDWLPLNIYTLNIYLRVLTIIFITRKVDNIRCFITEGLLSLMFGIFILLLCISGRTSLVSGVNFNTYVLVNVLFFSFLRLPVFGCVLHLPATIRFTL